MTYTQADIDYYHALVDKRDAEIEAFKQAHATALKTQLVLNAEIERLKAEFQKAKEWNQLGELQIKNLQSIVEDQDKLITELADALETKHRQDRWEGEGICLHCVGLDKLLQRAREATAK